VPHSQTHVQTKKSPTTQHIARPARIAQRYYGRTLTGFRRRYTQKQFYLPRLAPHDDHKHYQGILASNVLTVDGGGDVEARADLSLGHRVHQLRQVAGPLYSQYKTGREKQLAQTALQLHIAWSHCPTQHETKLMTPRKYIVSLTPVIRFVDNF
jgi:hypothetical protein